MAFTETFLQNQRWTQFSFFTDGGTDGAVTESLAPGKPFKLTEIRMHFSVAFASVEDFVLRLSAAQGSAHNAILISHALSDLTDFTWQPSIALEFQSDDHLVMGWSQVSGVNIGGLNVLGWAVFG